MNPRTSLGPEAPAPPVQIRSRTRRVAQAVEAEVRQTLLDLVDHGRLPTWLRGAIGGGLVVLGLVTLVLNLAGGR